MSEQFELTRSKRSLKIKTRKQVLRTYTISYVEPIHISAISKRTFERTTPVDTTALRKCLVFTKVKGMDTTSILSTQCTWCSMRDTTIVASSKLCKYIVLGKGYSPMSTI